MTIRNAPEAEQRAAVVAEARRWLRTPYHHEGSVCGGAVDCVMLLVEVYNASGVADIPDPRPYPRDWMLHRSEERYLDGMLQHARPVDVALPGDIVLWRYGRTFSHAGIVTTWPFVIHAFSMERMVAESDIEAQGPLSSRNHPRRFFSYWGK